MTSSGKPIPRRVLGIAAPCLLVAGLVAGKISDLLWLTIIPYLMFGIEKTRAETITVRIHARHYMTFSNGTAIDGWRFGLWDTLIGVMWLAFTIGLFMVLLHMAARIIRRRNPSLSHDILHCWTR
jgi:hypothetical protein